MKGHAEAAVDIADHGLQEEGGPQHETELLNERYMGFDVNIGIQVMQVHPHQDRHQDERDVDDTTTFAEVPYGIGLGI